MHPARQLGTRRRLEFYTLNFAPKVRREVLNGREYLVAPLSLIVPGVLAGSKGPLYYPPNECARNVGDWHGVPLTVYHPFEPATGEHVSADTPGVRERQGIGFVANPEAKGKLRAEGWFDVHNTELADRRFGSNILARLRSGQPIELSTGLYTDNIPAPPGSTYNGRIYDYVARNYKPDHVAILPDQIGACSINDGCGVHVTNTDPQCPT